MSTFAVALEALRRVQLALARDPDRAERERLLGLLAETADLLAASGRRRLPTQVLAERVAQLEQQLRDRDAGERRRMICERLGISKSRFYELRSPEQTGLDADLIDP